MAIPAILQQLGKSNMARMLQPVRQMMDMVRTAQDPQAAISQLAMSNPQMRQVMEIVQRHGGDPMKALREEAAAAGMDLNEIMNMLR